MQYLLIRNARLAEGDQDDTLKDVLVAEGRIVGIGRGLQHPLADTLDIDADGAYVIPALVGLNAARPQNIDGDTINSLNFDNICSGILTVVTSADSVEETLHEMHNMKSKRLNYATHFMLNHVTLSDARRLRRIMLVSGVSTAITNVCDSRQFNVSTLGQHMAAARQLGIRAIFDMRMVTDPKERWTALSAIVAELQKDVNYKAYILGIETEDELELASVLRGQCDVSCLLCYDPFAASEPDSNKLRANTIANTLRQGRWCTYGITYRANRALTQHWNEVTPEIVGRNRMTILNSLPCDEPLTVRELVEFTVTRPTSLLGLTPTLGNVCEGTLANIILWRHEGEETVTVETPYGTKADIKLKGQVDKVIMNGRVVMDDKLRPEAICGRHIYSRIV